MLLQQDINKKEPKSTIDEQMNEAMGENAINTSSNAKVKLAVGDVVVGKVKAQCKSYATLAVDGNDFILPADELSWRRKNNIKGVLSVGESIEAVVVAISDDGKVMLSMKRLRSDPWIDILQRYSTGMEVQGTICGIFPFGIIVRLESDVDGMLHKSEMPQDLLPVEKHFKLGEGIRVRLMGILPIERKMSFTIK